jgi:hypothetical protein
MNQRTNSVASHDATCRASSRLLQPVPGRADAAATAAFPDDELGGQPPDLRRLSRRSAAAGWVQACSPSKRIAWRTVVNGGIRSAAMLMSPKPATGTSAGTRMRLACRSVPD